MPLLEVRGLVKYYGRRKVVGGVDFQVDAGEVVGLLGPNGAGKTTSFRMTTGQITPHSGTVWFNGQDVTHLPMYKRARLGMGYLSQETSVFRRLSVEQNILAILEAMPASREKGRPLTRSERRQTTERVLEQFGLTRVRKNKASRLSGGEKRRLEIARCLVCEPLLILLDEPFTGIDPKTIADIQEIVRALRQQRIGILLTDHNVREALKITDRSYLIKDGQVRTHGTPHHIIHDPIAIAEYLGTGFNDGGFMTPMAGTSLPAPVAYAPGSPQVLSAPGFDGPGANTSGSEEPGAHAFGSGGPGADASGSEQRSSGTVHLVLHQERIRRLVEILKTPEQPTAAAELVEEGRTAVPALLDALERRDVELRRQAYHVLLLIDESASFDPFAPEALRRQQIADLREQFNRRAG
jgi:lipopolysaccharide export system ATP-binding protein